MVLLVLFALGDKVSKGTARVLTQTPTAVPPFEESEKRNNKSRH